MDYKQPKRHSMIMQQVPVKNSKMDTKIRKNHFIVRHCKVSLVSRCLNRERAGCLKVTQNCENENVNNCRNMNSKTCLIESVGHDEQRKST